MSRRARRSAHSQALLNLTLQFAALPKFHTGHVAREDLEATIDLALSANPEITRQDAYRVARSMGVLE